MSEVASPKRRIEPMGSKVRECPTCGAQILWLDGEATPALVYREKEFGPCNLAGRGQAIACEQCVVPGKKVEKVVPEPAHLSDLEELEAHRPADRRADDRRPVKQILKEDMQGVVELGEEAMDLAERAGKFFGRFFGEK